MKQNKLSEAQFSIQIKFVVRSKFKICYLKQNFRIEVNFLSKWRQSSETKCSFWSFYFSVICREISYFWQSFTFEANICYEVISSWISYLLHFALVEAIFLCCMRCIFYEVYFLCDLNWNPISEIKFLFNSLHGIGHFSNPTLRAITQLAILMLHYFVKLYKWSYAALNASHSIRVKE